MFKRLIFLGPPGVGKGTQAKRLAARFGLTHISTGGILREVSQRNTPLAQEVRSYMEQGLLVPDDLVLNLLLERLEGVGDREGYILDGYPRNLKQAEDLEKVGVVPEKVVYFTADEETLIKRISGRRICVRCGRIYNIYYSPPPKEGRCECGGELFQRQDDKEDVVRARLSEYYQKTAPLIKYYKEKNLLVEVTAEDDPDQVYENLRRVIEAP